MYIRKSNHSEPLQRWNYDSEDGTCKQFDYMGRKGNGNRFLTRQACEESCQPSQDPCELPKTPGPCDNRNERYFFDKDKGECFTFNWGENISTSIEYYYGKEQLCLTLTIDTTKYQFYCTNSRVS